MKKRGQGLPLNTIIIAILVVLVLVAIVAFFVGGSSGIIKTIKGVFFQTTAGTDMPLAIQTCNQRCGLAEQLPSATTRMSSAFCESYFNIDSDFDGEADLVDPIADKKVYKRWYCTGEGAAFTDAVGTHAAVSLGTACSFTCDTGDIPE
tara:strand:- start:69 stop:515 length:447 start_codon:yes stop_codon:yes gene_type:complete